MANTVNLGDYYLNNKIDNINGVSDTQKITGLGQVNKEALKESLFKPSQYTPNAGRFFGNTSNANLDSQINTDINILQMQGMNADNARAEYQTAVGRLGNALINNLVIAGTTAVSGTAGFLWGIVDSLVSDDLSKLYDNPINREMLQLQEATNRKLGNYYTEDYQDSSIWKKLGTSIFWADVLKNLGYTEGMLIPGMGVAKAMSSAPALLTSLTSSLVGAISEGSIEALQAKQDKLNTERTILNDKYNEALANASSYTERLILQEEYNKDLANMEEDSNQVGNTVLGLNMAILTASNMLEWGQLFTRGNKVSQINKRVKGKGVKSTDEGFSYNTKLEKAKQVGENLFKGYIEGQEEVLQDIAVRTANNYADFNSFNDSIFNDEKRELADSYIQAIGKSFSEAFRDNETATNFAMGFITGFFGAPQFRGIKNSEGKFQSPITMGGGVFETYKSFKDIDRKQKVIDEINSSIVNNPETQEYYNNLIRNLDFQEKASMALDSNDEKAFRDWQFMQMLSNVMSLTEIGQTDYLNSIIQTAKDLSNDEIQQLIDDGNFREGDRKLTVKEAREVINKNTSTLSNLIEEVTANTIRLESSEKGQRLSKEAKQSILAAQSLLKNQAERINIINDELKDIYYKNSNSQKRTLTEEELNDLILNTKGKETTEKLFSKYIADISENLDQVVIDDLNKKLEDRSKLNDSAKMLQEEIKKAYNNPEHANKKEESKIKTNIKKLVKKKNSEKAETLKASLNYQSFKYSLNDLMIENQEEANSILDELVDEGYEYAKTYKKIEDTYKEAVVEINKMDDASDNFKSDAKAFMENMIDKVSTFEDFVNPSSYQNPDDFFQNGISRSGDETKDLKRVNTALILVQRALNKVLNRNMEIQSLRALQEQGKDVKTPQGEEKTTGNSEVPQNPNPIDPTKPKEEKKEEKKQEEKKEELPVSTEQPSELGEKIATQTSEEKQQELEELSTVETKSKLDVERTPEDKIVFPEKEEPKTDSNTSIISKFKPLSFFFLPAKEQGKLIPITNPGALIDFAKKQGRKIMPDFGTIGNWFTRNKVQEYIDSGNLKVGDKIVLGVDPSVTDYKGNYAITIYKIDGNVAYPIGIYATNGNGGKNNSTELRNKILKEYKEFNKDKKHNKEIYYSSYSSHITSLKGGYVQFTGKLNPIKALPEKTKLAVIKNYKVIIGGEEVSDYILNDDITKSNGLVYAAMPTVNGSYRLVRLNTNNFDSSISTTSQLYTEIRGLMERMLKATTREELTPIIKELSAKLYIPDVDFFIGEMKEDPSIKVLRITKTAYDRDVNSKLRPVKRLVNGKEVIKQDVLAQFVLGTPTDEYLNSVMSKLLSLNFRIKVDAASLGNSKYVEKLLEANALSGTFEKYELEGAWFEYNPIDETGKELIPKEEEVDIPRQPQSTKSQMVYLEDGNIEIFEDGSYNDANGIHHEPSSYDEELRNKYLYSLQEQYKDAMNSPTMVDGKAIIGDKGINRRAGEWLTKEEYDEVVKQLDEINNKGKKETPKQEIDKTIDNAEKEQRALTEQEKKDIEEKAKEEPEELTELQRMTADLSELNDSDEAIYRTGVKPNKNGLFSSLLRGLEIGKAYSVKTFLRAMKPYFPNNLKPIYHLLSLADKLGVRIGFNNSKLDYELGYFDRTNNIIAIYVNPTNKEFYETLVHELIHSITHNVITKDNSYMNNLFTLYGRYLKDTKDNKLQFVEFLAKLGEAEFRSELESMKLPIRNIFTDLFTENYLEKADKIMSDFVKKELTLKDKEVLNRDADLAREDFSFMGFGWSNKATREEKIAAKMCKGI